MHGEKIKHSYQKKKTILKQTYLTINKQKLWRLGI